MTEHEIGQMGFSYAEVDDVAQSLAACLVDRGFPEELIRNKLSLPRYSSEDWWALYGGKAVDEFARFLELPAYPEDE